MGPGTTLYVPEPGTSYDSHLWMIISDPNNYPNDVVMVNFTSWADWKDQACVVNVGEHTYIKNKTCVNFPGAKVVRLEDLLQLLKSNRIKEHKPLSDELLERIRNAVLESRMKMHAAELLIEQGIIRNC